MTSVVKGLGLNPGLGLKRLRRRPEGVKNERALMEVRAGGLNVTIRSRKSDIRYIVTERLISSIAAVPVDR